MPLQLDDLAVLDAPTPEANGRPLMLPVEGIDEDPDQPRREFESTALHELAETIRARGVRQPISVRPNLQQPDRWVLNFGARRLRASRLAGLKEIPAFIDTTVDGYDQVIENEQREGLKPLELALFVQKRLAIGDTQAEIARRMGKSRAYVTHATALIDAPDWLMAAYREGRCKGLSDLYELRRLHAAHPQHVEAWASDRDTIAREGIRVLGTQLGHAEESIQPSSSQIVVTTEAGCGPVDAVGGQREEVRAAHPRAVPALRLQARLDGVVVSVIVDRAPDTAGDVFVSNSDDGVQVVDASRLTLLGFVAS